MKKEEKKSKLTFVDEAPAKVSKKGTIIEMVIVICECGKTKHVNKKQFENKNLRSCGCDSHRITHGGTRYGGKSSEYGIWSSMKNRCNNPNARFFKDYGERGIKLCNEWENDFQKFLSDMGRRPSKHHSIERIDNNLGYFKENCEWATMVKQTRNKRCNILISLNGETMCLKDMANKYSVPYARAYYRFQKGMSPQEILSSKNYGDRAAFKSGSKRIFPKTWKQDNNGKFRKPIK